jgi:lipoprotein-releasing system permease protein
MYKLLLCWRYLRTRYIALASIISVTLGVATMIVVNSVMQGFTGEMQNRIHGILSDVVIETYSLEGMPYTPELVARIRQAGGNDIEALSPTVVVPAMLDYQYGGMPVVRPVQLIGIDEETQGNVSDFCKYLQHPQNRRSMSFYLRENGYDVRDHQAGADAPERKQLEGAGWRYRRWVAKFKAPAEQNEQSKTLSQNVARPPSAVKERATQPKAPPAVDPFAPYAKNLAAPEGARFDPAKQQHTGIALGIALVSSRTSTGEDRFRVIPGDDVKLTFPTTARPPTAVSDNFTIVDFYESKMSEYDSTFVFVPIRKLQELRGMIDPTTGVANVNDIQIRLKPGANYEAVRDRLRAAFHGQPCVVDTWRDKQGALLAAVHLETMILNLLLFMIIAVAGFGILAIFCMIVVEKTRDIGILKSLGASGRGVMGIFLGYGLSLGLVGSGTGMIFGLLFVRYINQIANLLARVTGRPVFDPSIYYFYKIPAIVMPTTVAWIVVGALLIAVAASVWPAWRAARLHPVEALRYE